MLYSRRKQKFSIFLGEKVIDICWVLEGSPKYNTIARTPSIYTFQKKKREKLDYKNTQVTSPGLAVLTWQSPTQHESKKLSPSLSKHVRLAPGFVFLLLSLFTQVYILAILLS